MAPTSFHLQRILQQASIPQNNALKLENESLLHKVWAPFKGLLLHSSLGQMSPRTGPLRNIS